MKKLMRFRIDIKHDDFYAEKDGFITKEFLYNIRTSCTDKAINRSWDEMSINYIVLELSL